MAQFQAIVVIAGAMLLFVFIAFQLRETQGLGMRWIRNLFLMLSLLMVPLIVFVSMLVADINNLTALQSILEKTYGALVWLYMFLVMFLVIKFIVFMFNLFKLKKEREIEEDVF